MFKVRLHAMQALADVDGEIKCESGRVTSILAEASGYPGGLGGFNGLLKAMEADGLIVRNVGAKRTYGITLTEQGWSHCVRREVVSEPETEEPEPEAAVAIVEAPEPAFDYDELAIALLKNFAATLEPVVKDPELQKRLGRLHEHAESLGRRLKRVEEDRDAYADQVRARITEIGGLRDRLRQTEENLQQLIAVPATSLEHEQLDRLMREKVAVSMS